MDPILTIRGTKDLIRHRNIMISFPASQTNKGPWDAVSMNSPPSTPNSGNPVTSCRDHQQQPSTIFNLISRTSRNKTIQDVEIIFQVTKLNRQPKIPKEKGVKPGKQRVK